MALELGPKALAAGYRLAAYETIGSTSTEASAWATLGDPGRLWVAAKEQTAGHGRRGRAWETPRGNLAASLLIVRPEACAATATLGFAAGLALESAIRRVALGLASAVDDDGWHSDPLILRCGSDGGGTASKDGPEDVGNAVVRASKLASGEHLSMREEGRPPTAEASVRPLKPHAPSRLALKWPNDVLFDGAKVGGILLEAVTRPGAQTNLVIGIGVNVRHAPKGMPYPVTSLAECSADLSAETLFTALAEAWVDQEGLWNEGRGFPVIRNHWLERAEGLGSPIAVKIGEDVYRGIFETIDDEGRLIVRAGDGSSRAVSAGEVHFGAAATVRH